MNIIARNYHTPAKIIKNVKNLAISDTIPGVTIEVDNYMELFAELDKEGFKPQLQGRLINFEATAITAFD